MLIVRAGLEGGFSGAYSEGGVRGREGLVVLIVRAGL